MARNTVQQDIIYNTVINMDTHPSPDDVYEEVHKSYPTIGRATIYRVLNKLAESGRIIKVNIPDSADRFDFRKDRHLHMHCTSCNGVFDIDIKGADKILSELDDMISKGGSNADSFRINNLNISFEGICPECQKKEENNERFKGN